jgi:hypothetical protein
MKIGKPQSFLGDSVNIWSANLSAKTAYIREAEVVGDNDEEVGAFCHDKWQEVNPESSFSSNNTQVQ